MMRKFSGFLIVVDCGTNFYWSCDEPKNLRNDAIFVGKVNFFRG